MNRKQLDEISKKYLKPNSLQVYKTSRSYMILYSPMLQGRDKTFPAMMQTFFEDNNYLTAQMLVHKGAGASPVIDCYLRFLKDWKRDHPEAKVLLQILELKESRDIEVE